MIEKKITKATLELSFCLHIIKKGERQKHVAVI